MVGVGNLNKSHQKPTRKWPENENLLSPGFRSVAAMAGWDEEALLIASLIVEDTPDRQFRQKKRSVFNNLKTSPTNSTSRRKRRAQTRSPVSKVPVGILDLDEDEPKSKQENEKLSREEKTNTNVVERGRREEEVNAESSGVSSSIPCIDRLREELSCAICLEICYEPSTTPCGHSFCKKCLGSAADRCGKKCPKCRQLISNGRYCTVNTVLWNTIQLLFPKEVEARKAAADSATERRETQGGGRSHSNTQRRVVEAFNSSPDSNNSSGAERRRRRNRQGRIRLPTRTEMPVQDEDAALALRLQRQEFMEAFEAESDHHRSSITTARANLRAMASRAMNIRITGRRW